MRMTLLCGLRSIDPLDLPCTVISPFQTEYAYDAEPGDTRIIKVLYDAALVESITPHSLSSGCRLHESDPYIAVIRR